MHGAAAARWEYVMMEIYVLIAAYGSFEMGLKKLSKELKVKVKTLKEIFMQWKSF